MNLPYLIKAFVISASLFLMIIEQDKWATYILLAYMAFHY
jgi:hypothetical protein